MTISANIRRAKHINKFAYYDIEVMSDDIIKCENIFDKITEKLEDELVDYGVEILRCPWDREHDKNGKSIYGDCMSIEYEYGSMQEIHKDVMNVWKKIKREVGIR